MESISKTRLLAVEGIDEVNFFKVLLQKLNIDNVQMIPVGGKSQFKDKIPLLVKMPGFSDVQVLGIVRDRDDDGDAVFKSITNILRKCSLVPPEYPEQYTNGSPKVGVFIMPGNSIGGRYLEDLCLCTIDDLKRTTCAVEFIDCIMKMDEHPKEKDKSKAIVQTYLSTIEGIPTSLGVGAQKKGCWNFDSKKLDNLKFFLNELK